MSARALAAACAALCVVALSVGVPVGPSSAQTPGGESPVLPERGSPPEGEGLAGPDLLPEGEELDGAALGADIEEWLDRQGLLVLADGDRSIRLRPVDELPDGVDGDIDLDALAGLAASAYAPAGGNATANGALAKPSNWFVSDTGQLYLMVGGVIVVFEEHLDAAAIDAVFAGLGVDPGRVSSLGGFGDAYLVETESDAQTLRLVEALGSVPGVASAEPNMLSPAQFGDSPEERSDVPQATSPLLVSACSTANPPLSDAYSRCLWHLDADVGIRSTTVVPDTDINIDDVWGTTMGAGVNVVVIDSKMDYAHEDLADNVNRARSVDRPSHELDPHGTAVAGVVAARDNTVGGRGVAPRATVIGHDFLSVQSAARELEALNLHLGDVAAYNMSYGPHISSTVSRKPSAWKRAVDNGLANGFGGKGASYVVAAGNEYHRQATHPGAGWVSLIEMTNHIGTIPVCAVNALGRASSYSNRGPSLWVCAPSGEGPGVSGYPKILAPSPSNSYWAASGTSLAAPQVTGVVALMRAVNPDLTWRDVKLILAGTAQQVHPTDAGWQPAGIRYGSSSGRYMFSNDYGFGVVDAKAAVTAAANWTSAPALKTWSDRYSGSFVSMPGSKQKTSFTFDVQSDIDFVEHIDVSVSLYAKLRNFRITLESPSGTVSLLSPEAIKCRGACGINGVATLSSSRHLGEDPSGTWKLTFENKAGVCNNPKNFFGWLSLCPQGSQGPNDTFRGWAVTIHGHTRSSSTPSSAPVEVSIAADGNVTEGSNATFTLTASQVPAKDLAVSVAVADSGSYAASGQAGSRTATIKAGTTSAKLAVGTVDDSIDEPDGTITVTVGAGSGYTAGTPSTASAAVVDNDDSVAVSISAGSGMGEGSTAVFTLTASPAPAAPLAVSVDVADSGDFAMSGEAGARTVTIKAGSGSALLRVVTADDNADEPDGTITATIGSGNGYTVGAPSSASVAVSDNDVPAVSIAGGTDVVEGSPAVFTLTSSPKPAAAVSVQLLITKTGSFGVATGVRTVTVPAAGTASFTVATSDDTTDEPDGKVTVTVLSHQDYEIGAPTSASVAVVDDDVPVVSISAGSDMGEGSAAVFTVSASPAPWRDLPVPVDVVDSGDFAASGEAGSRTVTIKAGSGSALLRVVTVDDGVGEPDGTITATVGSGSGSGYTVGTPPSASVAVSDDDAVATADDGRPVLSVSAVRTGVGEGAAAWFVITADPVPQDVLFIGLSLTESGDFGASAEQLVAMTTATKYVAVRTVNDSAVEPDGSVTLTLLGHDAHWGGDEYALGAAVSASVSIVDNDEAVPSGPTVSVVRDAAGWLEGETVQFTVTALPALSLPLAVQVDVTATGGLAGSVASGTRTVVVPVTGSAAVSVATVDDLLFSGHGDIDVTVRAGAGYRVGQDNTAIATVLDDDIAGLSFPTVSVTGGEPVVEGGDAVFTLAASPAPMWDTPAVVSVTVRDGEGNLVSERRATVVIAGGAASATLRVPTVDDAVDAAGDGSVSVRLTRGDNPDYRFGQPRTATVVVNDNDDQPAGNSDTLTVAISSRISGSVGETLEFTITASDTAAQDVVVSYSLSSVGALVGGTDYDNAPGKITIPKGSTSAILRVPVAADATLYGWEHIFVRLTGVTGAKSITNDFGIARVHRRR